jgi:hypothetical protein
MVYNWISMLQFSEICFIHELDLTADNVKTLRRGVCSSSLLSLNNKPCTSLNFLDYNRHAEIKD